MPTRSTRSTRSTTDATTGTPTTTGLPLVLPARAGVRQWVALGVLLLPVLVISLDATVLSFAVPQISTALDPTSNQLLWMVDIYSLVLAGLLITMGTLGDTVGRRRLLLIGAAGFGLVSVGAAYAQTAEQLIAARALLGVFGATLMPSTLSLIRNVFLREEDRRLAVAIWAAGFSGGHALGPVVGGWLLEHFWWGSIFLVAVPAAVVLLIVGPFLLPESRNPRAGRLDLLSAAQSVVAMASLVYGIKHVATQGIDLVGLGVLAIALGAGAVFVRRQLLAAEPLLDMRLFTRPVFAASIGANFVGVFGMSGLMFFLSQYLQFVLGHTPMEAAFLLIPGAVAAIVAGLLAVVLARYLPLHVLIPGGILLETAGYVVAVGMGVDSADAVIVAVFVLVGAGAGLAETLTNDAILSAVPARRAGAASAISETAYELGVALGVAVLGSVLSFVYRAQVTPPPGLGAEQAAAVENTIGSALHAAQGMAPGLAEATTAAARQAFDAGVGVTSGIGAALTAVAAVAVWSVLRRALTRQR